MKIRFAAFLFLMMSISGAAFAQMTPSTDREAPTVITGASQSWRASDTNASGSTAYFMRINVEPGTVRARLEFTPPSTGGSMSIIFSGTDCCPSDSSLGGDEGGGERNITESTFTIRRAQALLLEIYVDTGAPGDVSFTLRLEGSVGGTGTPTCPDLSVNIARAISAKVGTKQIRVEIYGTVENNSAGDYISVAGLQSIRIRESSPIRVGTTVVFTQPFTSVRAGGRVPFVFTKLYTTADFLRLTPGFRAEIFYDPANASDDNPSNNDCGAANNFKAIPYELIKAPR